MMKNKIISFIEAHNMIHDGDTVVLAVSGGADSMCLLHFFKDYSTKKNINIICAHVHHGIRGAEADADAEFVRSFCLENNIEFKCAHYDVPRIADETGESHEACGRRLRYKFFNSISPNAKIATAHNLNDSMETVIFNLARGTSLKGLTGIPAVRDNIIRPILCLTRQEIEEYLFQNGIDFVTDSTNLSEDYARNKIRHNVIPVMKEINNGFSKVFTGCISSLSEIEDYLEKIADTAFCKLDNNGKFAVNELLALDKVIRDRVLMKICEDAGGYDISHKHIDLIVSILLKGGAVMLPGAVTIKSDGITLYKTQLKVEDIYIHYPYCKDMTEYKFPNITIKLINVDKSCINIYNDRDLNKEYIDSDKLKNAVFRSRNNGDRFKFPNAQHSKSLKNLFKEKDITPTSRIGVPMLADGEKILWINGVGVSDYAKVTPQTEKVVRIVVSDGVKG